MDLPDGVQRVRSRGKEYFYYQQGRNTAHAGPRIALPRDPRSPEFWQAIRQAQGIQGGPSPKTVAALIDAYTASTKFAGLGEGTREQYLTSLKFIRGMWGALPSIGLRPVHVRAMMEGLASKPGKANNVLGMLRALSSWAISHDHIDASLTEGVEPYEKKKGHKPWTEAQIRCVHEKLTGVFRRHVMLALYTGQRGSDIVRLGWTHIDEGGFALGQKKTGVEVWCPIVPELAAEMATWDRRPGPFVLQDSGKPYTRKLFSKHFAEVRDSIPDLHGVTLHGLRATAVVRLRRAGLSTAQIGDIVGMSLAMIERYCRFADKKANGQAALISMEERRRNTAVKR